MTKWKSRLVCEETCAKMLQKLGLQKYILSNVSSTPGILCDVFEAIIAAIFQNYGFQFVFDFLKRLYQDELYSISK